MILTLIAAMSRNHVIGKDNKMPWHLSVDLQHFKTLTMGKPIIMGRRTYESIGKALPGRRNIVVTRNAAFAAPHCEIAYSLGGALAMASDAIETMVIGGAEIFQEIIPRAQRMYLTVIDQDFEGDAFFPDWQEEEWEEVKRENHTADGYKFQFVDLVRVK